MPPLYHLKSLRLRCSLFSSTFASHPKSKPSAFSLHNHHLLCTHITTSEISENQLKDDNFTVKYLINSCGLSPKDATSASKWVELKSPERPESVLALLKDHGGLSETQISKFVKLHPKSLLAIPNKTLLPKLEFFSSLGVSRQDLAEILATNPRVLTRSLEKHIKPMCEFLKSMITEKNVVAVVKRCSRIFSENRAKNVVPNIGVLREFGMPQSSISVLLAHHTRFLMIDPKNFRQLVGEVKEMGFDLGHSRSVHALRALWGKPKLMWDWRCEVYMRWGWSEDDVLSAFRKSPQCMIVSEKKLMKAMEFFVNKMRWPSRMIARYPYVLNSSLEKRIIPRCLVFKVLVSKGLMNENFSLNYMLKPADEQFLKMFVNRYLSQVPQLLSVYQGNVGSEEDA